MKGTTSPAPSAPPERVRFNLTGRSTALDTRIHAARGDLADISLAGILFSAHYARAVELTCVAAGATLLDTPSIGAPATSELLRGESFHALDVTMHWAWGFCGHDGYVGYVRRDALDAHERPDHQVTAAVAPLFSAPDIKSPVADFWSRGTLFQGEAQAHFVATGDGYIHHRHAAPIDRLERDWVAVAKSYVGYPYVWGGRGYRGIDCSGLVQVALGRCGIKVPRDTDLQREGIGNALPHDAPLQSGDFVFFPGHVGIMIDAHNLVHANAHWMAVIIEPLADVIGRLKSDHPDPVIARRRIAQ